ncbi:MAG TPA: FtsW/RodA/SpoVE family cell cycle protein [Bryobacteraceae bacterium]|jgi:cell division protein FtsW|nr:FtsW/RodA/SpoVE family cell cycle protein [Bryobacteraceae bacterium]
MAQRLKTDWILFATVLVMVSFGVLILYSASSIMAELRYGSTWHFVVRQVAWAAVAIIAMMTLKRTHYRKFQNPAVAFSAIGIALLLLALVYLLDSAHHRWLRVGPIGLQPSELAKPALVIFLAFFVTWRARAINNARYTLAPAALAVGLVILAVVVADLGTAVVLGGAAAVVFFVAGLELRYCAIAGTVALIGVCLFVVKEPYRLARVVKFFDPEFKIVQKFDPQGRVKSRLEKSLTTRDTNYQLQQSKIAVGAGGVAGLGLMQGRQKLLYLPEAHTDFIYAVASEELGLIGSVGLLVGFFMILWRGWRTTFRMTDDFGRYLALGVTVVIVVQGLINISVVLGMMPTKGIPLPMISAGGSSLLSTLASLGILMNVSEHAG